MSENLLQNETSPYLLQHKDNPIHWRPWGKAAFEEARAKGKPIFLSVGYSTCHWCHVMAHESFEDAEVAEALNRDFVAIKVDREERPDVDQIYMSALQALSGGGGWPMSVWLTSEGKPFFAGTYFPKFRFLQLLRRITEIWTTEQGKLLEDAERLHQTVAQMNRDKVTDEEGGEAEQEEFLKAYPSHFQHHFDEENGGFGQAPKFPQTMNLMVMMRQDFITGLNQSEVMVKTTLEKMIRGGIRDHLCGGFHRYSVDEKWLVPHFEKMLYDQALITQTLIEAYQLYGGEELARAARETCDYVLRDMTHAKGGFFSAEDADSLDPEKGRKEEGYFCTFDFAELEKFLSEDELVTLNEFYGVTPSGNFEGRNILNRIEDTGEPPEMTEIFAKLKKLRASRPKPHLDDKIIVAWNGWMIASLCKAGAALGEPRYIEAARRALDFIAENLVDKSGGLRRFWREGEAKGSGLAEDYAAIVHAAIELAQVDGDPRLSKLALELQAQMDRRFWDFDEGNYFSNDGQDPLLPLRPRDDYDGVTPSSNSMAALNLARLYLLTGEAKFQNQAERLTQSLYPKLKRYPSSLAYLALALDFTLSEAKTVVTTEGWALALQTEALRKFSPHRLWVKASEESWPVAKGKLSAGPAVYICSASACQAPLKTASEARSELMK